MPAIPPLARLACALALGLTAAAGPVACGGPTYHGQAARVHDALEAYDHAERSGHIESECSRMLTPHYRRAISGTVGQCVTLLTRAKGPRGLKSITDVKVHGSTATAAIQTEDKSKGTAHLVARRGRWLIDGIDFTSLGD